MNDHELTILLERAGAGLSPDVPDLVARGSARGRALRRRRRTGGAVAALAVAGLALVPLLAVTGSERDAVEPAQPTGVRAVAVPLEQMGTVLASLLPGSRVADNPEPFHYEVQAGTVRWRGDGITMSIDSSGTNNSSTPDERCLAFVQRPGCIELADGSWTVSNELVSGRIGGDGSDLSTDTLEVRVWTPDGYLLKVDDAAPYVNDGTSTHVLDDERLLEIALDEVWFD